MKAPVKLEPTTADRDARFGRFRLLATIAATTLLFAVPFWLRRDGRPIAAPGSTAIHEILDRLEGTALVFDDGVEPPFFIDRFEVTNDQFAAFVAATRHRPTDDEGFLVHFSDSARGRFPPSLSLHPVVFVSFHDAEAYARWAGKDLPTEREWNRVARDVEKPNRDYVNSVESGIGQTVRVGTFERGAARLSWNVVPPVYDLLGNVREWTKTLGSGSRFGPALIVKGGSFNDSLRYADPSVEVLEEPRNRNFAQGFRCVVRDAESLVKQVVQEAAGADDATRRRVSDFLRRYGNPMLRLLHRMRFREAVRHLQPGADGNDDFLLPFSDGATATVDARGIVRVFDSASGDLLAERAGFSRVLDAISADLDHDGVEELYLSMQDAPTWPSGEDFADVTIPDLLIVLDRTGKTRLIDPERGRPLPWCRGFDALDDVVWWALDEAVWVGIDPSGMIAVGDPILATDPSTFGWVYGFVPRERQRIVRLDFIRGENALTVRWTRETPRSERILALADRGELVVPGLAQRRFSFGSDDIGSAHYDSTRSILDLRVYRWDGELMATSLVPGGAATMAPLDPATGSLYVQTVTGHELTLHREGAEFWASRFPAASPDTFLDKVLPGPRPGFRHFVRQFYRFDDVSYRFQELRLERVDSKGRITARQTLRDLGEVAPRVLPLRNSRSMLVARSDGTPICLDEQFEARWTREELRLVDLTRCEPVVFDYEGDGRREIAAQWGLTGVLFLGAESGTVQDGLQNPGSVLLKLDVAVLPDGRELLLAVYRDRGVYVLSPRHSELDRELRRLILELEPLPGAVHR